MPHATPPGSAALAHGSAPPGGSSSGSRTQEEAAMKDPGDKRTGDLFAPKPPQALTLPPRRDGQPRGQASPRYYEAMVEVRFRKFCGWFKQAAGRDLADHEDALLRAALQLNIPTQLLREAAIRHGGLVLAGISEARAAYQTASKPRRRS
jgi:hypothetical protein